jgi:hypothetical protein
MPAASAALRCAVSALWAFAPFSRALVGWFHQSLLGRGSRHCHGINFAKYSSARGLLYSWPAPTYFNWQNIASGLHSRALYLSFPSETLQLLRGYAPRSQRGSGETAGFPEVSLGLSASSLRILRARSATVNGFWMNDTPGVIISGRNSPLYPLM